MTSSPDLATAGDIIAALAPLVTVYGVGEKPASEWAALWEIYVKALSGVSTEALKAGVLAYTKDEKSERFPKPGPLRKFCDAVMGRIALRQKYDNYGPTGAWTWPTDDELSVLPPGAKIREYRIMANEARMKAGPMLEDGTYSHSEWAIRAKNYDEQRKRLQSLD